MLGPPKSRDLTEPIAVSLDELVPTGHFYRQLDCTLDLTFVRDLVQETYAGIGRPSIDPVVFFTLQLILFFEGLRSERQLMRVVADRLSLRWSVGYDLTETLPDHSSLTRIRERYGLAVFHRFFEAIAEQCIDAGRTVSVVVLQTIRRFFKGITIAANRGTDRSATASIASTLDIFHQAGSCVRQDTDHQGSGVDGVGSVQSGRDSRFLINDHRHAPGPRHRVDGCPGLRVRCRVVADGCALAADEARAKLLRARITVTNLADPVRGAHIADRLTTLALAAWLEIRRTAGDDVRIVGDVG
jgi:transposase